MNGNWHLFCPRRMLRRVLCFNEQLRRRTNGNETSHKMKTTKEKKCQYDKIEIPSMTITDLTDTQTNRTRLINSTISNRIQWRRSTRQSEHRSGNFGFFTHSLLHAFRIRPWTIERRRKKERKTWHWEAYGSFRFNGIRSSSSIAASEKNGIFVFSIETRRLEARSLMMMMKEPVEVSLSSSLLFFRADQMMIELRIKEWFRAWSWISINRRHQSNNKWSSKEKRNCSILSDAGSEIIQPSFHRLNGWKG